MQQIHDAPNYGVLAVTGGGSGAISALLGIPGASRTVLEALVPYSPPSLATLLGAAPGQACSERTARSMAMAAFLRARTYVEDASDGHLFGLAATCSLASDRPKRGDHRIYVACQTPSRTTSWTLKLAKGLRDRAGEESVATSLILNLLANTCRIGQHLNISVVDGERTETVTVDAPQSWQDLLNGRTAVVAEDESRLPPSLAFPGAFNPLHDGHRRMASVAEKRSGAPALFELSILNVDKPPLDFVEMRNRAEQFSGNLLLTRAPTFVEKAMLFPGTTFVVGADTLARIGDAKYYGGDSEKMRAGIRTIAEQGCRFLVFGRASRGTFETIDVLDVPPELKQLCTQVPESEFRADLSSTELRK